MGLLPLTFKIHVHLACWCPLSVVCCERSCAQSLCEHVMDYLAGERQLSWTFLCTLLHASSWFIEHSRGCHVSLSPAILYEFCNTKWPSNHTNSQSWWCCFGFLLGIMFRIEFLSKNSPDRGQSRKLRFSKTSGVRTKETLVNSVFCCFSWEKSTKCSQNPGLVNEFSATPRGQLNWTGPIANSSDSH